MTDEFDIEEIVKPLGIVTHKLKFNYSLEKKVTN